MVSQNAPIEGDLSDQMTATVLGALRRARVLFGGDTAPVDPPVFAAARDLEDDLGRGTFSPRAART